MDPMASDMSSPKSGRCATHNGMDLQREVDGGKKQPTTAGRWRSDACVRDAGGIRCRARHLVLMRSWSRRARAGHDPPAMTSW